jgi:Mn2+/Fe2+ NRAMP family transporter
MTIARAVLGTGAVVCGFASVGSWLLLQLGGVTPPEGFATAMVMYGAAVTFIACVAGAAYLRERLNGSLAVWRRALFLAGAFGLPVPIFYIAVSRGAVLQLPEIDLTLVAFVLLIAVFRPKNQPDAESKL